MTEGDYAAFLEEFDRLHAALAGYRSKPEESRAKADAYFHALKRFPLHEVTAKADRWLQTEAKMPKPAEWAGVHVTQGADIPQLTHDEEREYLRAEALFYEDAPCVCRACVEAGVSEKPLRFVPEFTREDLDSQARIGDRVITRGHWAHGSELARYYQARSDFWNRYYELLGKRGFPSETPRHARNERQLTKVGS